MSSQLPRDVHVHSSAPNSISVSDLAEKHLSGEEEETLLCY